MIKKDPLEKLVRSLYGKKTLRSEMKKWLKHWYLGGGTSFNRKLLSSEEKKLESAYYQYILRLIDQNISNEACPLTREKMEREK